MISYNNKAKCHSNGGLNNPHNIPHRIKALEANINQSIQAFNDLQKHHGYTLQLKPEIKDDKVILKQAK